MVKQFQTSFPVRQLQKLREIAEDTGLSIAEIIRRAVDEYLEKRKRTNRD